MPRTVKNVTNRQTPAAKRWEPIHYLKQWREERGYNQEAFGERVGMDHSSISKLETGKTKLVEPTIQRLSNVLGISPGDLFRDPRDNHGIWALAEELSRLPRERLKVIRAVIASLDKVSSDF